VSVIGAVAPQVDHGRHRDAGGSQMRGQRIGAVVVGEDDGVPSRRHPIAVEVRTHGAGQHDAGAIIVGEDERPFVRAGGDHNIPGANLPEALSLSAALGAQNQVLIVIAEGCRAGEAAYLRHGGELGNGRPSPGVVLGVEQPAAELLLLVHQDHAVPSPSRLERRP